MPKKISRRSFLKKAAATGLALSPGCALPRERIEKRIGYVSSTATVPFFSASAISFAEKRAFAEKMKKTPHLRNACNLLIENIDSFSRHLGELKKIDAQMKEAIARGKNFDEIGNCHEATARYLQVLHREIGILSKELEEKIEKMKGTQGFPRA